MRTVAVEHIKHERSYDFERAINDAFTIIERDHRDARFVDIKYCATDRQYSALIVYTYESATNGADHAAPSNADGADRP